VGELYQITNGINPFNPNPNLKPENVISTELAVRRRFEDGVLRLSLFTESVKQALITQTVASGTFVDNVDRIRNTGLELGAQKDNAWFRGLSLFGSVTYVDSRIEADSTWKGTTQVIHKHVPYVPDWRATAGATIHPNDRWSLTGALRYSGRQYSTLDNTDNTPKVYGAFDRFMVVDARVQYKACRNATIHAGVDNLTGTNYTLFHPFPGRTFTTGVKVEF
jgi:iron complex outermembrane receptor protein